MYHIPTQVPYLCLISLVFILPGLSNATGALKLKGRKASEDAPIVKILREAGAIPLCNTNVPELCTSWETTNYITGKTVNPYDFSRTPGGSSGGEVRMSLCSTSL
jgi:Asp-tRNAAsn/Glu-tRNAGln amidotransferase A subunit and related amidases